MFFDPPATRAARSYAATSAAYHRNVVDRKRVALISNFPPTGCGIATFAGDVADALENSADIVRWTLVDQKDDRDYTILRSDEQAYVAAAQAIDAAGYDVVWIQHEFGIFGGADGSHLLTLLEHLATPVIATMHTILERPTASQRRIVEAMVARCSRLVAMCRHGAELLCSVYGARADQVLLVEHGSPDRPFNRGAMFKAQLGLTGRKVMMTFGLLGPGKGIENVIAALPAIARRHPDVLYRIVGATHPKLVEREGERYRETLQAQVRDLGVAAHVEFLDAFLEQEELLDQIEACDVYLTPYPNLAQATSGTLSYAVALGKAVVSSPFVHARELLANDVGCLVDTRDPAAIAAAVGDLFDHPDRLFDIQARAYLRGRSTVWAAFAGKMDACIRAVCRQDRPVPVEVEDTAPLDEMTDDVGLLQHARFTIANRRHGYCLDDNARALSLAVRLQHDRPDAAARRRILTYAAFVEDAWDPAERVFRNFMGYDRRWLEPKGSDDSHGRAFKCIGHVMAQAMDGDVRDWATALYDDVAHGVLDTDSPRAAAFACLGACERLSVDPHHVVSRRIVRGSLDFLTRLLAEARRPDWVWFESVVGYDNARLCEALIRGGAVLNDDDAVRLGLATLTWIGEQQAAAKGHFRPVGSESFGRDHNVLPFDQQPLEIEAHIDACLAAWRVTQDAAWVEEAQTAFAWFDGWNDRGVSLVDAQTGRCYDGLTPQGRNRNSGAESILAYIVSRHAIAALPPAAPVREDRGRGRDADARGAAGDPVVTA